MKRVTCLLLRDEMSMNRLCSTNAHHVDDRGNNPVDIQAHIYAVESRCGRRSQVKTSQITMPALSSTMTEGKISQWLVNVGDKVEAGDMVLVVESDKADMDVETYEEGFIAQVELPHDHIWC